VHDHKRDAYLKSVGNRIVRFSNDQVLNDPETVLNAIFEAASPRPLGEGQGEGHGARYRDTVLFIDARHIYRQVDRAHRNWTDAQIGFIANIVRLYREEELDFTLGGDEAKKKLIEIFSPSPAKAGEGRVEGKLKYRDILGLCKVTTLKEIEIQGWSINPGRYVGVAPGEVVSDEDFKETLEELNEELETLSAHARELEETIARNVAELLE
jgi:type I restriction enzyme M protein